MKSLAKETAIYGLSSIIGRFLNYLLVPLYTAKMTAESGGYGVITNMYAITALLLVLLTFGMETTFFRFATKGDDLPSRVFSTALIGVSSAATLFFFAVLLFLTPVSSFLGYEQTPQYVWVMALTVSVDAIRAIPFAYLRQQKKALKFATLQLLNIGINIVLNVIYYLGMDGHDPGYAFYINLLCSVVITLCLAKEIANIRCGFDPALMRRMLVYAWPIVLLGIVGILNQVADKILFPFVYPGDDMREQLGIYGACVKIAMIMAMITQAFRYAYEPFVFNSSKSNGSDGNNENNGELQAKAMKYFIIFTLLAFLCVVGWLDVLKYIIPENYRVGLRVVPIVMAAEIMMGIYFNLSFWYKLSDKTYWGAVFASIGCAVLIAVNVFFVPRFGYMACAWAGFVGYAVSMTLSYIVGQRLHPIPYPMQQIAYYIILALVSWLSMKYFADILPQWGSLIYNTLVIIFFVTIIVRQDFPLSNLPVVGKYFRR
ncbi:MAG: lipopolysaccharide biosynthesis protein [Prevotella sp.]|nr:lipopolysaccharide biosynthesis protein [Prevotella sp.]